MAVLLTLASSNAAHVRHRFQQLSVVDFFVRELSLEFEATQPGGGRTPLPGVDSSGSFLDQMSRPGSTGFLQSGVRRQSTTDGTLEVPRPASAVSKRGRTQSSNQLLHLSSTRKESGSPYHTPSPPVPKLRLPGSRPQSSESAKQLSGAESPRRLAFGRGASSRRDSPPRGTSRMGREAQAAAQAATEGGGSGSRPLVPRLGLGGLGLSSPEADDEDDLESSLSADPGPTVPSDDSEDEDGRISTVAAVHVPPLELLPRRVTSPSGTGVGRPLDRAISTAISLDKGWMPSERTEEAVNEAAVEDGDGPSVEETPRDVPEAVPWSPPKLPTGFVFSGDLDEDVERLEALEREAEEESSDVASSISSDSEVAATPVAPTPSRRTPLLSLASLGLSRLGSKSASRSSAALTPAAAQEPVATAPQIPKPPAEQVSPILPVSVPRLVVPPKDPSAMSELSSTATLPDSPPPRAVPPPVPRLALTPSMHSTLEARMASEELQGVEEAERSRRQAGRSFFGDLERSALGKGKMQAATLARRGRFPNDHGASSGNIAGLLGGGAATPGGGISSANMGVEAVSYAEGRARRMVYRDAELHLEALVLVFTLILNPRGQLDQNYCDQYPWDRKLQNIPFILHHHLNHPDNRSLLPRLLPALHALGAPAVRLLRTLCAAFFRPSWYSRRVRISGVAGAYATVYRCALPAWAGDTSVVLKLLDTPKHIQDRCTQVDFHSEVTILDTLAGQPRACQMFDFGLDPGADALILVLKDYRCSLKQWRAAQPADPAAQLRLYYAVFRDIVVAVGQLLEAGIIHFDLKCDNILLELLPGRNEAEFWAPTSSTPPFKVVLADFGESKLAEGAAAGGSGDPATMTAAAVAAALATGATTSRARGTDAFKSPEMLLVGGAVHKGHRAYDRRRRQGAGAASDVWSLGCLLYELVTGRLLFSDTDWLQLVARVTSANMPLITEERAQAVSELPGVLDLLQYILVRDPALRPTLKDTLAKLDMALALHGHGLPDHRPARGTSPPHLPEVQGAGKATASLREPTEEALPLVAPLPIYPGLLLGPAVDMQRKALRDASAGRVMVIASRSDATAAEIMVPEILADEVLSGCLAAAAAVGATCEVLSGPPDDGDEACTTEEVLQWLGTALDQLESPWPATAHRSVLLAAQPGREGAAVLLLLAHVMHAEGCSPYHAMVRASHWGVDLHLKDVHLDALRVLGERVKRGL